MPPRAHADATARPDARQRTTLYTHTSPLQRHSQRLLTRVRAYYIYDVSISASLHYYIYMIQYIVYVYVGLYNDIIILYLLCVIL